MFTCAYSTCQVLLFSLHHMLLSLGQLTIILLPNIELRVALLCIPFAIKTLIQHSKGGLLPPHVHLLQTLRAWHASELSKSTQCATSEFGPHQATCKQRAGHLTGTILYLFCLLLSIGNELAFISSPCICAKV